jgi:3-oxoacyl-[acyl-carrier-protein] synthase-3
MATSTVPNVRLAGLSAAVPRHQEDNNLFPGFNGDEAQKLIKATGIRFRRIASPEVCTSDLCATAADRLIDALGWQREDIGALVFVTQTPDYDLPATAPILQHRLGLGMHCLAFDIILGCSGYAYGLASLASLVSAMGIQRAVLLVGDTMSKITHPLDKSARPLFGDAGTATALSYDQTAEPMTFHLASDGSGASAIMIPDGGYRNLVDERSFEEVKESSGILRNRLQVRLNGPDVFNFTLREVPLSVKTACDAAGVATDDVDAFVFHQANFMMNEVIRNKLGIPLEKHPYSLDEFGNTSSATIPLTLVTRCSELLSSKSATFVLSGFGVGLSWGTVVINTSNVKCLLLAEV